MRDACALGILLALPLAGMHLFLLGASLEAHALLPAALALVLGIAAVDGLTGLVHWACDTWGDERTPWLGPHLIRAFREHHRDPGAMLRHDWVEVNREPAIAATAAFVLLAAPPLREPLLAHPVAHAFLWGFVAFGGLANQLHRWAHGGSRPAWVGWLQRRRLILSPRSHAVHHRAPHTRGYCISTGWLNPALDLAGFWRALERVVRATTGARPRAHGAPERVDSPSDSRNGSRIDSQRQRKQQPRRSIGGGRTT